MSLEEIVLLYKCVLEKSFCKNISDVIISYINIVANNTCNWCRGIEDALNNGRSILCHYKYNHSGELTKDAYFDYCYCGYFNNKRSLIEEVLDIDACKDVCDALDMRKYINYEQLYDDIIAEKFTVSHRDYEFYKGHLFSYDPRWRTMRPGEQ